MMTKVLHRKMSMPSDVTTVPQSVPGRVAVEFMPIASAVLSPNKGQREPRIELTSPNRTVIFLLRGMRRIIFTINGKYTSAYISCHLTFPCFVI